MRQSSNVIYLDFMLSQSSWFAKKRVLSEQDLDGPPIDTNNQKL